MRKKKKTHLKTASLLIPVRKKRPHFHAVNGFLCAAEEHSEQARCSSRRAGGAELCPWPKSRKSAQEQPLPSHARPVLCTHIRRCFGCSPQRFCGWGWVCEQGAERFGAVPTPSAIWGLFLSLDSSACAVFLSAPRGTFGCAAPGAPPLNFLQQFVVLTQTAQSPQKRIILSIY